ncbi:hypothetical protein ACQEU8_02395 [Streptomyces sp. CA-250714]|uniref:hypothetical protein n=1 Tax=Streptomyces sp. CA-250714 TaxID=3240060 RepID=UPI003D8C89FF
MSTDERRERYAAAIREARGLAGVFADVSPEVSAAIAVADEEQQSVKSELVGAYAGASVLRQECARLRAELRSAKFDLARIRGNIDNGGTSDRALIRSISRIVGEGPTA